MYQDEGYEIYMNADGTAKNAEDDKIVDANKEIIDNLYNKANNMGKLQ